MELKIDVQVKALKSITAGVDMEQHAAAAASDLEFLKNNTSEIFGVRFFVLAFS